MASFLGFVDDAGKFALDDQSGFRAYVQKFKGHEVIVTVKRRAKFQGSQSMRYYRGVVVPAIAEASGVSDPDDYEDVHNALAWKFLRLPDGMFGEPRRRSTAKDDLTQEEMTRYIDECITFAETSIPGCRVPRPEEAELDHVHDPGWS